MLSAYAGFSTELTTLPSASPREILGGQNNIVIIVIVGKYMQVFNNNKFWSGTIDMDAPNADALSSKGNYSIKQVKTNRGKYE